MTTPPVFESFDLYSPYSDVGPYRATDYWNLPEGTLCELIEGRLIMSPSPTSLHQTVLLILSEVFLQAARATNGIALVAPMDVVLADDAILQPDLLFVSQPRREIVKDRVEGPPDLVVEILSAGTERRDRVEKLELYARYGVQEYWIVDPAARLCEFLLNEGGRYVVSSARAERYQSPRCPEIDFDLAEFWREVARRLP